MTSRRWTGFTTIPGVTYREEPVTPHPRRLLPPPTTAPDTGDDDMPVSYMRHPNGAIALTEFTRWNTRSSPPRSSSSKPRSHRWAAPREVNPVTAEQWALITVHDSTSRRSTPQHEMAEQHNEQPFPDRTASSPAHWSPSLNALVALSVITLTAEQILGDQRRPRRRVGDLRPPVRHPQPSGRGRRRRRRPIVPADPPAAMTRRPPPVVRRVDLCRSPTGGALPPGPPSLPRQRPRAPEHGPVLGPGTGWRGLLSTRQQGTTPHAYKPRWTASTASSSWAPACRRTVRIGRPVEIRWRR